MKPSCALVGCGRIAPNHIQAALNNGLAVSALCDTDLPKAKALAAQFGLEDAGIYSDAAAMLSEIRPGLTAIAASSGAHGSLAALALSQGSHVIVEKPLALSLEEAKEICRLSRETGLLAMPCHQNRFNPAVSQLKAALDGGLLGKPLYITAHVRWNRGEKYYRQAPWRGTWAEDGGVLMNQSIHSADLLLWLMGSPLERVWGRVKNMAHPEIQAEDVGLVILEFENGCLGLLEGTSCAYSSNLEETLCFFGTKGTVKLGGTSLNRIDCWRLEGDSRDLAAMKAAYDQEPPSVYGFGHTPLYANVLAAAEGRQAPLIAPEEGAAAVEAVLAAYLSSRTGKQVRLPLGDVACRDFEGMFS